jgi:hypothetical protein
MKDHADEINEEMDILRVNALQIRDVLSDTKDILLGKIKKEFLNSCLAPDKSHTTVATSLNYNPRECEEVYEGHEEFDSDEDYEY